jgi:hypothetical protein
VILAALGYLTLRKIKTQEHKIKADLDWESQRGLRQAYAAELRSRFEWFRKTANNLVNKPKASQVTSFRNVLGEWLDRNELLAFCQNRQVWNKWLSASFVGEIKPGVLPRDAPVNVNAAGEFTKDIYRLVIPSVDDRDFRWTSPSSE